MTDNTENTNTNTGNAGNNPEQLNQIGVTMDQIEQRIDNALEQLETATTMLHSVIDKLIDAETPGFWSDFTDEEAERAGAFDEEAISEQAAYEASFDNPNV